MTKRFNQSDNPKQQFNDEFEDFGYEVKNVRRSSKKKVAKFKREINEYDDTYWTVHYHLIFNPVRVLYTCSGFFFMMRLHQLPNGKFLVHEGLRSDEAIERMENHKRWCEEHREELQRDSQQLFDDMFGG